MLSSEAEILELTFKLLSRSVPGEEELSMHWYVKLHSRMFPARLFTEDLGAHW